MSEKQINNIEYKSNNNLPIIKKGWKGNIVIKERFYNDLTPIKSPVKEYKMEVKY